MKDLIKNAAKAAAIAVAASTLLTGCGVEIHYDEELSKVLNDQPYRPDWKGPAPLYYVNEGVPGNIRVGGARVFVGIGDPTGKWNSDPNLNSKVKLYEGFDGSFAINAGRSSLTVVYDPKKNEYRAYSKRVTNKGIADYFGLSDFSLAYDRTAETHPLKAMRQVISGKPVDNAKIDFRNINELSKNDARRIAALNQKYQ